MGRLFFTFLTLILILCLPLAANAAEVAEIYTISGTATVQRAGNTDWKPLSKGQRLSEKDTIQVGSGSRVGIRFDDGKLVRLRENSELTITPAANGTPRGVSLLEGAMHLFNRSRSDLRSIKTPEVSAAIRGTEVVAETKDGESSFTVFDGEVVLSNAHGQLRLARGDVGKASANSAPKKLLTTKPLDEVEWVLYFPTLLSKVEYPSLANGSAGPLADAFELAGDQKFTKSLSTLSTLKGDQEALLLQGTIQILLGRIEEAQSSLGNITAPELTSSAKARLGTIALVKQDLSQAEELYQQSTSSTPVSPASALLGSFLKTSRGEIPAATEEIEQALQQFPGEPTLLARKSELLMGQGHTEQALEIAQLAYVASPNDPVINSILGFAHLARRHNEEATQSFNAALELSGDLSVAHFGLGLSQIAEGDLEAGRSELEQAVHLDTSRSLYRSYLGKAFFEEKREDEAGKEYDLAIERDPNDPTPYLYRAFNSLSQNQVISALADVEDSIERNNNRAVYRSRELLDQDIAVRTTSLAEVFRQLGFREIARIEALKSLSSDYTNYSAHRFLGEVLEGDFYADAKFSQGIISELLSPLSFNTFESYDGFSAESSANDYAALFDRPGHNTDLNLGGTNVNDQYRGSIVQTGKEGDFGYLASYGYLNEGASTIEQNNGRVALQYQPSVDSRYIVQGAIVSLDDTETEDDIDQLDVEASIGGYHRLSTDTELLTRIEYFGRDADIDNDLTSDPASQILLLDTGTMIFPEFDIDLSQMNDEDSDSVRGNAQVLHRYEYGTFIGGAEYLYTDGEATEDSVIVSDSAGYFTGLGRDRDSRATYDTNTVSVYGYLNGQVNEWLGLTGGLSYRDVELPNFDVTAPYVSGERSVDEFLPKAGFTITPDDQWTVRGAYFQNLGSSSVNDIGSIEPTVVGSFVQLLGDLPGAKSENYGIGLDFKIPNEVYAGAEYIYRDIDRNGLTYSTDFTVDAAMLTDTFALSGSGVGEREEEDLIRGYLYVPIGEHWASMIEYRRDALEAIDIGEKNEVDRIRTGARYFSDALWFLVAEVDWYYQDLEGVSGYADGSDDFWIANAGIGFRLPERQGLFQVQIINIFDEEFTYASRDRFTDPPEGIGFLTNLSLNF